MHAHVTARYEFSQRMVRTCMPVVLQHALQPPGHVFSRGRRVASTRVRLRVAAACRDVWRRLESPAP